MRAFVASQEATIPGQPTTPTPAASGTPARRCTGRASVHASAAAPHARSMRHRGGGTSTARGPLARRLSLPGRSRAEFAPALPAGLRVCWSVYRITFADGAACARWAASQSRPAFPPTWL